MLKNGSFSNLYVKTNYTIDRIAPPGWQIGSPMLRCHSLVYVYSGEGVFRCNDEIVRAGKHSLIYFPRKCVQSIESHECEDLKYYTINFYAFITKNFEEGDVEHVYHEWETKDAEFDFPFVKNIKDSHLEKSIITIFKRLCRMYLTGTPAMIDRINKLHSILELLVLADSAFKDDSKPKTQDIVKTVTEYISKNYHKKITLKELAEVADVAPSYLNSLFKNETLQTPINYVSGVRIAKSKELLDENLSISEVASRVGFSDAFYFSNCFKKHEGMSPSTYQKRHITH